MPSNVALSLVLDDEFTPLTAFDARMQKVDARFAGIEADLARLMPERFGELEAKLTEVQNELAALKQSAAAAADLESQGERLAGVETGLQDVAGRLGNFSFACGCVEDLSGLGTLPAERVFVVVDTPENLQKLQAEGDDNPLAMSLVFGAA